MQYMGGKFHIASQLADYINAIPGDKYLEPFVGGASVVSKITKPVRLACDTNEYLICMYQRLQSGWVPPTSVSEDEYYHVRDNPDEDKALTAFVGFGCSFHGKWFDGYAKNRRGDNYARAASRSLTKLLPYIVSVDFFSCDYQDLHPRGYVIYCDPPYQDTTKYSAVGDFDHDEFWSIVRLWSKDNTVLVSEYVAPPDFTCVLSIPTKTSMRDSNGAFIPRVEKLFQFVC